MMYGWGYRGYDVWGFVSTLVMMAVIVVTGVYVVRYLVSAGSHEQHRMHPGVEEDALSILKKRYAKGEIDKKEYEEKKKDLAD